MNIEHSSRRRIKKAICIIVFFILGGLVGYCLPARARTEAKDEPSKIRILNFQKIQRLNDFKIEVTRLTGGDHPTYKVNLLANMELAEPDMGPLFDQFRVGGGD